VRLDVVALAMLRIDSQGSRGLWYLELTSVIRSCDIDHIRSTAPSIALVYRAAVQVRETPQALRAFEIP
jgi:hypothetical protein